MDIYQIAIIGIIATVCILFIKQVRPDIAILAAIGGGVIILLQLIYPVSELIKSLEEITGQAGIAPGFIGIMMKTTAIALITVAASALCKDAEQGSVAFAVELSGKIAILLTAMPVMNGLFEVIKKTMNT